MKFRSHTRRFATTALALVACAALAAPAAAEPGSDYPQPSVAKIGDTPADFGQPVAVEYEQPTTIEVVRPERTIVRDVDEVLPLVFSSTALLIALGGGAFLLVGGVRRGRVGRIR